MSGTNMTTTPEQERHMQTRGLYSHNNLVSSNPITTVVLQNGLVQYPLPLTTYHCS